MNPNLALGHGFCSDDTEHVQMVARAIAVSQGDLDQFDKELAQQFRCWLLTIPAGVGLATLRACVKLLVGFSPDHSGVFSAGNGPAMRSAILGVCAESDEELNELVERNTRITHTDPKAYEGAWVVARAARISVSGEPYCAGTFLEEICRLVKGNELRMRLDAVRDFLGREQTAEEFSDAQGWQRGIGGYVNETVPAAIYCWARSPQDYRQAVEHAVALGGDTDTVAAITGAISGANLGDAAIPSEWLARIVMWPRGEKWMQALATTLTDSSKPIPNMNWMRTLPRNVLFAVIVLAIGFRRLLPPY